MPRARLTGPPKRRRGGPIHESRNIGGMKNCIALIGMPGAGKSTVGQWLADRLHLRFVDTDDLIVRKAGAPLQAIIETAGLDALRAREEEALLSLTDVPAVIATGGSAVYSAKGMAHLGALARIFYLQCDPAIAVRRMGDHAGRGIVKAPGQTIAELHREREQLYLAYADHLIDSQDRPVETVGAEILALLATADNDLKKS